MAKVVCRECGGQGVRDSGAQDQAGHWINIPCESCRGSGKQELSDLLYDVLEEAMRNDEVRFEDGMVALDECRTRLFGFFTHDMILDVFREQGLI